jgi:hypothetical protein
MGPVVGGFNSKKMLVIENHHPISMVEYKYLKPPTVDNIEIDQQTWGIGWSKHQTLGLLGLVGTVFAAEKLDALAAIWIDQVKEHRGIGAGSLELHLAALLPFRGQRLGKKTQLSGIVVVFSQRLDFCGTDF